MNAGLDFLNEFKEIHIPRDLVDQYSQFFNKLEENNFTLCSWMQQTFWENTRDPIFRIAFLKRIFDFCNKLFKENKKPNEIPYRYLNSLLTIFLLMISYKFDTDVKSIRSTSETDSNNNDITIIGDELIHHESLYRYIQSWFSLATVYANTFFPELFDSIHSKFKTVEAQGTLFFEKAINYILDQQNIPIIDYSIPFFTLYTLFSYLQRNPNEIENFTKTLKEILSKSLNLYKLKLLLHIIYLALIFFPGTIKNDIADAMNPLLGKSGFVSLACAEIGSNIQKEKHYPGYTYYLQMNELANMNLAFSGNVPTFLPSSSQFVISLLYNYYPENSIASLPTSIISFSRFYLKAKFQFEKELSIPELIKFGSQLEFTSENSSKLAKMFQIPYKDRSKQKTSDESDQKSKKSSNESKRRSKKKIDLNSIEFPTHPFTKYQIQKLSLDFEINSSTLVDYKDSTSIYTTTASFIFLKSIFTPIKNYIKTAYNPQLQEYHILLLGDDFLIGNALLSYVKAQISMKECLSQISLIFHIVPTDDTKSNQIADFISSFDPIYQLFVRHLFPIMCSISPTINEKSEVSEIPLILDTDSNDETSNDKNRFDNTIWFGNPNPFNMFNFGIQHYLQFAKNSVDVMVWKCVIYYRDETNKTVLVPFVSSIQIGQAFARTSQFLIPPSMQGQINNQSSMSLTPQNTPNMPTMSSNEITNLNDIEQETNDESAFLSSSLEFNEAAVGMQGILLAKNESKIKTRANYQEIDIEKFTTILPKNNNDENGEDEVSNAAGQSQSQQISSMTSDIDSFEFSEGKKQRRKTASSTMTPKKAEVDNATSFRAKRDSFNNNNKRSAKRNNSFSAQVHTDNIDIDDSDSYLLVITDCSKKTVIRTTKVKSVAIWNANADLHASPSDGWLMMEYTSAAKIRFNNESSRIDNADKLYQELITDATINCINENCSFNATIDQSVYGPLKKISISPLLCDYEKDGRMRMKFASFSPFM